ncbi:MAG: DnaD domain protein [Dehalococcoidia bacterium]|nr:MAG: DnaD domain protein [Dehalococcoidia bacterium]
MELEKSRFEGFPAGALATTIPNLFFTAVLPRISDPAELVVSLYCFFAHGRKKGQPRFLTYAELSADRVLAAALDPLGEGALRRGVDAAVERGTLLRLDVEPEPVAGGHEGQTQELYFLNTAAGRRQVTAIEAGEQRLGRLLPSPTEPPELKPNIFDLYEQHIGPLTPMVAEELKDAEGQYPADWFEPAFRIAVEQNKRSWSYIAAILRRWETEGPDYEKAGRDSEGPGRKRSLSGRYRHLVRH